MRYLSHINGRISAMTNQETYLITRDLDDLIITYLEPPSVLTLTEVNVHYAKKLSEKQNQFDWTRMNIVAMCEYRWIIKWGIDSCKRALLRVEILFKDNPFAKSRMKNALVIDIVRKGDTLFGLLCKKRIYRRCRLLLTVMERGDRKDV